MSLKDVFAAISHTTISPAMVNAVIQAMHAAESAFPKSSGAQKKAWVVASVMSLLTTFNIAWLPDIVEVPLKKALVSFLVEILFSLLFAQGNTLRGAMLVDSASPIEG